MKNHYKILQIPRTSTQKDIKNKTKDLISQIKKSNIKSEEKKSLSNQVYESYKFLSDYHKRKSLDDYLDSQYNIIQPRQSLINTNDFFGNEMGLLGGIFNMSFDLPENISNNKSYFYSKSSSTVGKLDKDGNWVSTVTEHTNDNGKKDKKEYKKITKKDNIKKEKPSLVWEF